MQLTPGGDITEPSAQPLGSSKRPGDPGQAQLVSPLPQQVLHILQSLGRTFRKESSQIPYSQRGDILFMSQVPFPSWRELVNWVETALTMVQ